jgi:uncharacterized membrane protein
MTANGLQVCMKKRSASVAMLLNNGGINAGKHPIHPMLVVFPIGL